MQRLVRRFSDAGLVLIPAGQPIGGPQNESVFGMTILRKLRKNTRSEYFSIWPGDSSNRLEVVSVDKRKRHVVLLVHEPRREVHHRFTKAQAKRTSIPTAATGVKRNKDGSVEFVTLSPSRKRHFLCGVDERQLFIAQLPRGVTTVRDAHGSLESVELTLFEGRAPGKTVRQGEWFFLNPTPEESEQLERTISDHSVVVQKKASIGRVAGRNFGNPHTADEVVVLAAPRLEHGHPVRERPDVFVRGRVRHPDHKTVSFKTWRKVIRNAETDEGRMEGIDWID